MIRWACRGRKLRGVVGQGSECGGFQELAWAVSKNESRVVELLGECAMDEPLIGPNERRVG